MLMSELVPDLADQQKVSPYPPAQQDTSRIQRLRHQHSVVQGGGDLASEAAGDVFVPHCDGNRSKVSAMSPLLGIL